MTPSIDNSVMKEDLSDTDEVFEEALEELSDDFENILSNETLDIASEEIGENEQIRAQALAEVTHWLQSQPHLRNSRTDPSFILRFLRTNKFKIEKTCAMIERYLKMRMDHPKWFQNLDIEVHTLQHSFSLDIFTPDARTRLCWSSYRADTSSCCLRGTGRGGEWCGAWPGLWTPPGTTPATCSGPTSRPSRWVKLRIRAQIDYSDSDLGRRIVFVRPNLKSPPGKIQPQERSQNFTSAAVPLESSSKTSHPVFFYYSWDRQTVIYTCYAHMDKLLTFSQELERDCGEELGKYFYRANIQNIFYCDHSKKCPYLRRTAGAVWDKLK